MGCFQPKDIKNLKNENEKSVQQNRGSQNEEFYNHYNQSLSNQIDIQQEDQDSDQINMKDSKRQELYDTQRQLDDQKWYEQEELQEKQRKEFVKKKEEEQQEIGMQIQEKEQELNQAQQDDPITKQLQKDIDDMNKELKILSTSLKQEKMKISEGFLRRHNKQWNKNKIKSARDFEYIFKLHHRCNPFSLKLCNDGTMLFEASNEIHEEHITQLCLSLLSMGRFVHVNLGSAGYQDGSAFFYQSEDIKNKLQGSQEEYSKWLQEGQTIMNEFLHAKEEQLSQVALIEQQKQVTYRAVEDEIYPKYYKHRDTINAWSFSKKTPWCPHTLVNRLKLVWKNIGSIRQQRKDSGQYKQIQNIINGFKKHLKTHNLYEVLYNACKMIGFNQVLLSEFKNYLTGLCKDYNKTQYDNVKHEAIFPEPKNLQRIVEKIIELMFKQECPEDLNFNRPKKPMKLELEFTGDLIINFEKANMKDQNLQIGEQYVITQDNYNYPGLRNAHYVVMDNWQKGINIARKSQNSQQISHIQIDRDLKNISRDQMHIMYSEEGVYWVQQSRQISRDCFVQISHRNPLLLQKGMLIFSGYQADYMIAVDEVVQDPFQQVTRNGEELIRFIYKKDQNDNKYYGIRAGNTDRSFLTKVNQQFLKGNGNIQGRIILENEDCYKDQYGGDENGYIQFNSSGQAQQDIIPILTKGYQKPYPYNARKCFYVNINDEENIGHWGDICYEGKTGWYIKATKKAERSSRSLKVIFKNFDEWYDKNCKYEPSQLLLVQNNMKIGLAVGEGYVFKCKTKYRHLEAY